MAKKTIPDAVPETTVSVTALTPVQYDGDNYAPGESLDVRASSLAQLVETGAVQVAATSDQAT